MHTFNRPVNNALHVHVFLLLLFQAVDLLKRFLVYHSKERISAAEVNTCIACEQKKKNEETTESNSLTEDCRHFGLGRRKVKSSTLFCLHIKILPVNPHSMVIVYL